MSKEITWQIDLTPLIGVKVKAETVEGLFLRGVLRRVDFHSFKMAGFELQVPTHLAMDDELIPLTQLVSIEQL